MSVHFDRGAYAVRWREDGKQRSRRFGTEPEAIAFDEERHGRTRPEPPAAPPDAGPADSVYAYGTNRGTRFRFVFRQSDGSLSTRRGFRSRRAAVTARRKLVESIDRGEVKVARETFGTFWDRILEEKRPYVTTGSHEDFVTHGRKRLLPTFGEKRISDIDDQLVRQWLAAMAEEVESGRVGPKTVNNARTCLSVVLNEACRRGLLHRNPCTGVPALPVDRRELDYLRLGEIGLYLDACAPHYAPLAAFLIGTGTRVSEALDVRFRHLELEHGVVRIYRQRGRQGAGSQATKGKRFRSVQIGPGLVAKLRELRAARSAVADDWLFLCPPPRRGRYAGRTELRPPSRGTVHGWHEAALQDAGLRDMPLHALRHTAAASWLITDHPLIFVQRQLGHRSITTTEEHYGHLEVTFMQEAVATTEAAIVKAARLDP